MWTVAEAKSQLSEVLRKARNGEPQVIGTQGRCVVISEERYLELQGEKQHDGQWLLDLGRSVGCELILPDRNADRSSDLFAE